ncbi:glucosidase II beta subunit-like protein-domain-containing protein [Staphylotrichum tortipilum]|uniref:Endoplasmic reticulum lectin n=1 Tax=Staphylotrichum tortipilum TaxID=2831512 RepID=A0AAN6RPX7_9PEZI|nr:glucosidase II beta subunit-like protein-domain-containing protein [Staphylotrichum longicolle]
MRRLNLVLLASLQLAQARQPSFSIHDDVLAHPEYEVVIGSDFISESDALSILESSRSRDAPAPAASALPSDVSRTDKREPSDTAGAHGDRDHDAESDDETQISETYEIINNAPFRYLCSVPVLAPPPALNRTATELAKAEEAREFTRASAKGWELMSDLDGTCMYFTAGWWSYSFCYGKDVAQFHALPGRPGEPPMRDEKSLEYILGKTPAPNNPEQDAETTTSSNTGLAPPNAQLQVKGDQRYLSQQLDDGTICDLTGRPRTIEVQYHCAPGATTDRIGWVKEVTTCTYLMTVYTPRLCADMAFLPPKETHAHPIHCRPIASTDEEEALWQYYQRLEAGDVLLSPQKAKTPKPAAGRDVPQNHFAGTTIGGVVVGAHRFIGDDLAHKLPLPRGVSRQPAPAVEILASKKGGADEVEAMSDEELVKLKLDPKEVKRYRDAMQLTAGDRGWELQLVEGEDGELEYMGAFDKDEEGQEGEQKKGNKEEGKGVQNGGGTKEKAVKQEKEAKGGKKEKEEQATDGSQGSEEEFFKDEL